jgi:hypothetical protein
MDRLMKSEQQSAIWNNPSRSLTFWRSGGIRDYRLAWEKAVVGQLVI